MLQLLYREVPVSDRYIKFLIISNWEKLLHDNNNNNNTFSNKRIIN